MTYRKIKKNPTSRHLDAKQERKRRALRRTYLYVLAALFGTLPAAARGAPQGGQVVGGEGTIAQGDNNTTTITQQSASLAIDWQNFNLSVDEMVRFLQPSASSAVLNRILDQNPSQIFGAIEANGRVFLSNPNGLIFGQSATINAGSFVASGLDIASDDFMQGRYTFGTPGKEGGAVINYGLMNAATGGSVSLIGSTVQNEGTIVAHYGTVNLGAGRTVAVDFDGDGLLRFQVDGAVLSNALGVSAAVDNQGQISAAGGAVLLTAAAAQDVFTRSINNDGLIEAGRIDNQGGVVRLAGNGEGQIIASGTINVTTDGITVAGTVGAEAGHVALEPGEITLDGEVTDNDAYLTTGGAIAQNSSTVGASLVERVSTNSAAINVAGKLIATNKSLWHIEPTNARAEGLTLGAITQETAGNGAVVISETIDGIGVAGAVNLVTKDGPVDPDMGAIAAELGKR